MTVGDKQGELAGLDRRWLWRFVEGGKGNQSINDECPELLNKIAEAHAFAVEVELVIERSSDGEMPREVPVGEHVAHLLQPPQLVGALDLVQPESLASW